MLSPQRQEIMEYLESQKIQTRILPPSLHLAPQFCRANDKFPNSEFIDKQAFYLPSGPDQTEQNQHHDPIEASLPLDREFLTD